MVGSGDFTTDRQFHAIILLGMLIRLVWVAFVPVEPVSDSAAYTTLARTLSEHGVYGWTPDQPIAFWAVGTSALVAATFALGFSGFEGVIALNLAASLAIMWLVWRLAELWFDRLTALIATAAIAAWPNLIFFTSIVSSELFFMALALLGLWFWERQHGPPLLNVFLCGLVWGAACYVRPIVLLLPVALIIASLPKGIAETRTAALKAVATIVIVLAVVAPWTYRNAQLFGEPILVSSNFGANLWMGNNPETNGTYMYMPKWSESLPENERDKVLGKIAKDYIMSDIPSFIGRTLRKAVTLHAGETIGVTWNQSAIQRGLGDRGVTTLKFLASGYWFAMLAAGLGGIVLLSRKYFVAAIVHPAVISWAYLVAIPAIIVADQRYHIPANPFIAILAATLIVHFLQRYLSVSAAQPCNLKK